MDRVEILCMLYNYNTFVIELINICLCGTFFVECNCLIQTEYHISILFPLMNYHLWVFSFPGAVLWIRFLSLFLLQDIILCSFWVFHSTKKQNLPSHFKFASVTFQMGIPLISTHHLLCGRSERSTFVGDRETDCYDFSECSCFRGM